MCSSWLARLHGVEPELALDSALTSAPAGVASRTVEEQRPLSGLAQHAAAVQVGKVPEAGSGVTAHIRQGELALVLSPAATRVSLDAVEDVVRRET
jgi:hypothetical protein